jgi:hypothetical protein
MPLERLRSGYDTLQHALENEWSKYHQAPAPAINDGLPDHSAPPAADDDIPGFLDRRKANGPAEASYIDLVEGNR